MRPDAEPPPTVDQTGAAVSGKRLGSTIPASIDTPTEHPNQAGPDLEHELAEAHLIAGRSGLVERLARYGITDAVQRLTEIIGADAIMPGGRLFNPNWTLSLSARASLTREQWLVTPIRYWDGQIENMVAWRPNCTTFYLRREWPVVLGAGVDQDFAGNKIDPLGDSIEKPLVVYGSIAAWHRHRLGPGIVLLSDDLGELWNTRQVVTDCATMARHLSSAGIDARVIGEAVYAAA